MDKKMMKKFSNKERKPIQNEGGGGIKKERNTGK